MKYYSTRDLGHKSPVSLKDAAFNGLAKDAGLYLPESIRKADMNLIERLSASSYADMASYLAQLIFDDLEPADVDREVRSAYDFPAPLKKISDNLYTLELFHGPTFAFKDFGARFMGRMTGLLNDGEDIIILTATSGDTGSAVAHGFYGIKGVKVVVLYPEGKVSPLQEAQMTTLGGNIHPVKVRGNFDDCQRLVKAMFRDSALRESVRMTSANSINILRWIPQSFYYFHAYCQWKRQTGRDMPVICVPSGNYGNLAGGMLARRMGLPVRHFIAASNSNDVIPEYLATGEYRPRPSVQTVANAMDVGDPSNFERMQSLCGHSFEAMKEEIKGFSFDDDAIMTGIRELKDRYGYISDPHSAAGYLGIKEADADGFWLSTAHAAKFGGVIAKATGSDPVLPDSLRKMMDKSRHFISMPADEGMLADFLIELNRGK